MKEESSKFGLHVSWARTKVQNFVEATNDADDVIIDGNKVNVGTEFIYLGSKVCSHEVTGHIAMTAGVVEDLDDVCRQHSLIIATKFHIYFTCVLAAYCMMPKREQ